MEISTDTQVSPWESVETLGSGRAKSSSSWPTLTSMASVVVHSPTSSE